MGAAIRVLVADDHELIAEGLARALNPYGIDASQFVTDGSRVAETFAASRTDVLVLDLRLGEILGLDVASNILKDHPHARIVFFSQYDEVPIVRQSYRIGGMAFIPKSAEPCVLAEAIKSASRGTRYFHPDTLARVDLEEYLGPLHKLSAFELLVFSRFVAGLGVSDVANDLKLRPCTVQMVKDSIKTTLGLTRTSEFAAIAKRQQLYDLLAARSNPIGQTPRMGTSH